MAVMNRIYTVLLVVLVVLCHAIAAQSEKSPITELSSVEIEEQIQVSLLRYPSADSSSHFLYLRMAPAMLYRAISKHPQGCYSP